MTVWTSRHIRALRPPKEPVDPWRAYATHVEEEYSRAGHIESSGTVFITNRECPFTCLMCDLWKYTTDVSVPTGAVAGQVAAAMDGMPEVQQLKLFNAGNFFDDKAVSPGDRATIAGRLSGRGPAGGTPDRVIVENHPRMVDDRVAAFRDAAEIDVDVAMGLETVHPKVLPRLNKGMTLGDFEAATTRLRGSGMHVRAFILVRPPFLSESEGVEWGCRSLDFAFAAGVECCSVIPTRGGNGVLDVLTAEGDFTPPTLASLEAVAEYGVNLGLGRVFADLWDVGRMTTCPECAQARVDRMRVMNFTQAVPASVACDCVAGPV